MQMLLPFKRIWSSRSVWMLPSGKNSLCINQATQHHHVHKFLPCQEHGDRYTTTYISITSSSTMSGIHTAATAVSTTRLSPSSTPFISYVLTYLSKPIKVPMSSFSPFMITQSRAPTHLSTSSTHTIQNE